MSTTTAELDLSPFERREYTTYPTPLEAMPKLSAELGGKVNLFIKRDDLSGTMSRKVEYIMADAIKQGADAIVTCGAAQSDHCRSTLGACKREGLKCGLVLENRVSEELQQDAHIQDNSRRLLGADWIRRDVPSDEAADALEQMAETVRAHGHRVYCIPVGSGTPLGAAGYVHCAEEIQASHLCLCCAFFSVTLLWFF